MNNKVKEYLRLGRVFNAETIALIYVFSYLLAAKLYEVQFDAKIIIGLFIAGVLSQVGGSYNNDRLDLSIDKKAAYCANKPLVSGSISIKNAKIVEFSSFVVVILIIVGISPKISTMVYLFGAGFIGYLYNRYNKSNMFINVFGLMCLVFIVLIGMSVVVDFDGIVFLSAIIIGLAGIYLNIIEADLKDVEGDVVNVPKALGVEFKGGVAVNVTKLYLLNEGLKFCMFILVLSVLFLEQAGLAIILIACVFFIINFFVRRAMFDNLSANREKMKPYIAAQELTTMLFVTTIYMIIHPLLPLVIVLFVIFWLSVWNKILWGTYLRPQV